MRSATPSTAHVIAPREFEIGDLDWDFADARKGKTSQHVHGVLSYTSKFIPQIPRQILAEYGGDAELVVDPFCGSGTTIVETVLANKRAIGFDVNPVAVLLSGSKALPPDARTLDRSLSRFYEQIRTVPSAPPSSTSLDGWSGSREVPSDDCAMSSFLRRLYTAQSIRTLCQLRQRILEIPDISFRRLAMVAFLATVRRASLLVGNFGNDYVPRKKIATVEPLSFLQKELLDYVKRVREFLPIMRGGTASVLKADARRIPLGDEEADLVLTHPPYVAAVPYAEYWKLELEWMGESQLSLEGRLLGGRRNSRDVIQRFERGYGEALSEIARILQPNGLAFLVVGNPKQRGAVIDLDNMTQKLAVHTGLRFEGRACRQKVDTTHAWHKQETILMFRRT